jgi:uncharacterized membrane protein YeiH
MVQSKPLRLASVILALIGVMLVALGVTTIAHPEIMERYGIAAPDAHAKSTIIAVIGGAEFGLGMFLLLGRRLGVAMSAQIYSMLFLFAGILSARIISVFILLPELPPVFFRELFIELAIAGTLGYLAYQLKENIS